MNSCLDHVTGLDSEVSHESESKPKILLVEDERITQLTTRRWLLDAGYEVLVTGDGGQAMSLLDRESPDLVLLDLSLEVGDPFSGGSFDGFAVLEWMRRRATDQKTPPVIVLTGRKEAGLKERLLEVGATAFFPKPVDRERLHRAIQIALA